jgi:hypothetical protein
MYGGTFAVELRPCAYPERPRPPTLPETEMPTLHLPAAHTDSDVALAAEVAGAVGSHELYVSWTHSEGAGLPPEIETVVHERREPDAVSPFAEVLVAMVQGIAALWQAIIHPPSARPELPGPGDDGGRATRPAAGEPSA